MKNSISDYRDKQIQEILKQKADGIIENGYKALRIGSFNYVPITGSYGGNEKSLIIFNISITDAKLLSKEFGQESFFFGRCYAEENHTSDIAYYESSDGCKTYKLIEISNTITLEDDAEDFFSKFGFKYRINLQLYGDDVIPVENDGTFEEDYDSTFMSRAKERRDNRKNYMNK